MTDLEHHLASALRRERPPAGFADRVMQRIRDDEQRRRFAWLAPRHLRIAQRIAAGVILAASLATWGGYQTSRAIRGHQARRDVLRALHIASAKVRLARHILTSTSE